MEKAPKSFLGRLIVLVLFCAVVGYFAVAIVGSVVTDLYGGPPANASGELDARERTWCIRTIVGLRDELENQVTVEMQRPGRAGDPFARWREWEAQWTARYEAGKGRCVGFGNTALDRGYERLASLHHGYTAAVDAVIATRSQVAPGLVESLAELKKQR